MSKAAESHGDEQEAESDDPGPHRHVRAHADHSEVGEQGNDIKDQTDDPGDLFRGLPAALRHAETSCVAASPHSIRNQRQARLSRFTGRSRILSVVADLSVTMPDSLHLRLQKAVAGQYALVRLLGRGGMGAVYLARDQELDRLVALKVLPPGVGDTTEGRARFRREAQLAAKLTHPNIVPLHSFGESDGLLYYVMGYVRGESLGDRLRRESRIPHEETRRHLAQLAEALAYAHGKGVIHRDIKPDNILLDDETGQPLLADFGIARAAAELGGTQTEPGTIVGTVHYMSPEQASGATAVDGRSDLYSLGVVGYVMLAGQTPFDGRTFPAFVAQQASADPPPLASRVPDLAPDLGAAIMRCLARDVTSRWSDARAFKQSLGAALEDDSERLPGELREIAGGVFWSLVSGWMAANVMALALSVPARRWWTVLPAALLPGAIFVGTAAFHTRKGFSWADMRRVAVWPPAWWPFWWPAAWRRPGDLWARLPPTVRRVRTFYGVLAIAVLLALPLALRSSTRPAFLLVISIGWIVLTAAMMYVAWWAHRSGIPNNADLRSLFLRSSTDRRFWKRPQMARRLLAAAGRAAEKPPTTPAEYVRHIVEATQRMTGQTRDAGLTVVEVARHAFASLEEFDRDIAALATPTDDERAVARLNVLTGKRADVVQGLDTLWKEHVRVVRENTDTAAQRLTEIARSIEQNLRGERPTETSGDAETMGGTMV